MTERRADAVGADVADLAAFADHGDDLQAQLVELADRIAGSRAAVAAQLGGGPPTPDGPGGLAELVRQVGANTAFIRRLVADLADQRQVTAVGAAGRVDASRTGLLVQVGLAPDGAAGPLTYPLYLASQTSLTGSVTSDWAVRVRKQTFNPRRHGRWVGRAGYPRWQWPQLSVDRTHWVTKRNQAVDVARWRNVSRWAGRLGVAAALAGGGWSEWRESATDPSLSTANRVGRSATVAVTTAGGSWAGVLAGSQAGAAIGTFICPGVGTVIGGFVGGFVGGLAGGMIGDRLGQELKARGGELVDGAVEALADLADLGGDALDALAFWDR